MVNYPMAHSRPVAVKLPPDLAEACESRAEALGYASLSAYLKGLIRYDLLVQGPHTITLPIAHLIAQDEDVNRAWGTPPAPPRKKAKPAGKKNVTPE
jgi:hypothetical protein